MVAVTIVEDGKQIVNRTFAESDDAFAWLGKSRYKWEAVTATRLESPVRPDCHAEISGDY